MSIHPSCLSEEQLLKQCTVRHERRSGPGGQHRNKVETAVVIEHDSSGMRGEGSERRSQVDNRRVAIERLRLSLAVQLRSSVPATEPSELWQARVRNGRIVVSKQHRDFACLMAECLDRLQESDYDMTDCATFLGVSPSQIMKLLRQHPAALASVNAQRVLRGWHKLD